MSKNRDLGNYKEGALSPVQSSSTDTTAGALMAVGAFGLGKQTISSEVDADNYTTPGSYISVSGGHVNFPPAGNNTRAIVFVAGGSSYISQTVYQITGNRVWTRAGPTVTGVDWVEVFNSGNILGTVSQSGGVPTGAIIERGSNANGEYVKYADGTLICTKVENVMGNNNTIQGVPNLTFAHTYVLAPFAVNVTASISGTTTKRVNTFRVGKPSTTEVTVVFEFDVNILDTDEVAYMMIAIGRWY